MRVNPRISILGWLTCQSVPYLLPYCSDSPLAETVTASPRGREVENGQTPHTYMQKLHGLQARRAVTGMHAPCYVQSVRDLEILERSVAEFRRRLDVVTPDQWNLPTPCAEWTVRELVHHVVEGNRLACLLLSGATSEHATAAARAGDSQGDVHALFQASVDRQAHAFAAEGALERVLDHPAGRVTGREYARYRAADIVVHAWDLARAISADEGLDPALVHMALTTYVPWVAGASTEGLFGARASGIVPEGASEQWRLLDALGRRP